MNRRPLRKNQRSFFRSDSAVSEIVGYILSFALSAVFLLIALTSFWTAQQNTDSVVTAAEMKTIANSISGRVVEAGLIGSEFPNATLNVAVAIPQAINGHPYTVALDPAGTQVIVKTVDGLYTATSTTFNMDKTSVAVVSSPTISSSNEKVVVTYQYVASAGPTQKQQISLG